MTMRLICMLVFLWQTLSARSTSDGLMSQALTLAKSGREAEAFALFEQYVREFPEDGLGWSNLGVATMRLGSQTENDDESRRLLFKAIDHFRRSLCLNVDSNTVENFGFAQKNLEIRHRVNMPIFQDDDLVKKHPSEFCSLDHTLAQSPECTWDSNMLAPATVAQRLRTDCQSARVKITKKERKSGLLNLDTLLKAKQMMRTCGVVIFQRLFDKTIISTLKKKQLEHFEEFRQRINRSEETNTTSSAQRSPLRYEVKFDSIAHPEFAASNLLRNPLLYAFVKSFLRTNSLEVDTHSSVTSLPGAPAQHWHQDTGSLFDDETWLELQQHPPTHGLVVFVALDDVKSENGPTEFVAGSHLTCAKASKVPVQIEDRIFEFCPFLDSPVQVRATMPAGSAAVFDLRILHRGLANTASADRHLIYMSYVRDWFFDRVNFKDVHTARYDAWDSARQKLLRRVDSADYIRKLEQRLHELGANITALKGGASDLLLRA